MSAQSENPFRNYRHTASLSGPPVFMFSLILILASIQPDGGWLLRMTLLVIALGIPVGFLAGKLSVPVQTKKENEHYDTPQKRKYMVFSFTCSISGLIAFGWLAISILKGWLLINMQVLVPSMLGGLTVALLTSALLWKTFSRPAEKE